MNNTTETQEHSTKIAENNSFSAIDIGTTKIVAISGYTNEKGELTVLGKGYAPSMGISRGEIINLQHSISAINQAVNKAKQEAGFFNPKVVVGIAGKHIHSTQNRWFINRKDADSPITQDEIEVLRTDNRHVNIEPDEEIIHTIPQTFRIDNEHEVIDPIGMTGRRIEANFHIVIGKANAIRFIKNAIQRAGLEIKDFMLEPLASGKATLTEDEKDLGVAIVDIGGGTTDIAIYHQNIVQFTEVIPFGGKAVTHDISKGCNILPQDAEKLKIKYGNSIQDFTADNEFVSIPGISGRPPKEISIKHLSGIIQARMEEILDAALFVIKTSGYAGKLGAGIVVTGGGSLLKNLPQLLTYKIGIDSKIGTPIEYINYIHKAEFNNPVYSTGVGLLMHAESIHIPEPIQETEEEEETKTEKTTQKKKEIPEQKKTKIKKPGAKEFFAKKIEEFFSGNEYEDTKL
ncbi:MAG: cell division protein FtsA [Bacteroidales bacterium]